MSSHEDGRAFDRLFDNAFMNNNGCIEYKLSPNHGGYGTVWYNKRSHVAHRVAYMLCVDDIPEGMCVLHRCDNRSCVNPAHLFLGTKVDNINDMIQKDRHGKKLTKEQKQEIYVKLKQGISQYDLAKQYGVSRSAIGWWSRRQQ